MKRKTIVDEAYLRDLERTKERCTTLVDIIEEKGNIGVYDALVILGYKEKAKKMSEKRRLPYTLSGGELRRCKRA